MTDDLLRLVDSIHRDKGIDKESLFTMIESALASAARKRFESESEIEVTIDRASGAITATEDGEPIDPRLFGRIAAQTAKQVIIQKIREAEQDVLFDDFEAKIGDLVVGSVQRFERGTLIVNLGKAEGLVPRGEQIFNENYRPGERIRAFVLEVKRKGQRVVIILSRGHPNLVRTLFEMEVPEISDRIVEVKNVVREPGHKTKIAVTSSDPRVDCIGACVGVRGSRIRNIVDELGGEKIDIVRWSEADEVYVRNALSPAEITQVELDKETNRALVVVPEDQLSLAIGRRGQNVRLSAKLTGWDIDIMVEEEYRKAREQDRDEMKKIAEAVEGFDTSQVDSLLMSGLRNLNVITRKSVEELAAAKGMDEDMAKRLKEYAEVRDAEVQEERAVAKAERQRLEQEKRAAEQAERAAVAEAVGATTAPTAPAEAEGETTAETAPTEAADATTAETAPAEAAETPEAGEAEPETTEPEDGQTQPAGGVESAPNDQG